MRAPWRPFVKSTIIQCLTWESRCFHTPLFYPLMHMSHTSWGMENPISETNIHVSQIDGLNKNKAKAEKDKANMERDLGEARGGLDEAMRERANMEKNCKMTQGLIVESNTKMDELARALNEADSTKKKLQVEAQDLNRQIEETENALNQLGKLLSDLVCLLLHQLNLSFFIPWIHSIMASSPWWQSVALQQLT